MGVPIIVSDSYQSIVRACLMAASVAMPGVSENIFCNTFRLCIELKPSITNAATESSNDSPAGILVINACSEAFILSLRSTMIRWAVLPPIPFTAFSAASCPDAIALSS